MIIVKLILELLFICLVLYWILFAIALLYGGVVSIYYELSKFRKNRLKKKAKKMLYERIY